MNVLIVLILIIEVFFLFYLLFPFVVVLLAKMKGEKVPSEVPPKEDFACIITAYRNIDISIPLVESLINQQYPNYHVYLVADNGSIDNITFEHPNFTLLHPQPPLNLKIRSIKHAIEHFVRAHSSIIIYDSDNLAAETSLVELNNYHSQGFDAVQGRRTAKNLDSGYARADATGELYKNYIERYAPYVLGSSSVISGSGMSIETDLYNAYLDSPEINEGHQKGRKMMQEDKILQNFLLRNGGRIAFAKNSFCYDEKVSDGEQVKTQRSRWLFSYFQNVPNSSGLLLSGLFGLNWNKFLFGIMTLAPPLFIQLFLSLFLLTINVLLGWYGMAFAFFIGISVFISNIFIVLLIEGAPLSIWKSIYVIPKFIWNQFLGLFKMINPEKNFDPTKVEKELNIDEMD